MGRSYLVDKCDLWLLCYLIGDKDLLYAFVSLNFQCVFLFIYIYSILFVSSEYTKKFLVDWGMKKMLKNFKWENY